MDTGEVSTIAGNGTQGKDYQGGIEGNKQSLASPWDICLGFSPGSIDKNEEIKEDVLFIAMAGTHQIWGLMLTDTTWWKGTERKSGRCYANFVGKRRKRNQRRNGEHSQQLAERRI